MNFIDKPLESTSLSDKVLILTGTGRSGTTYMVGLLRRVYGFGLSAEVKDALKLNENLKRFDLQAEKGFAQGIEQLSQSRVLRHAVGKNIISRVDKEMIKDFVAERSPQGLLLALLRYVAVIREAGPALPAFKDPGALRQLPQLLVLFPNARVINMIRRGEDVAGSTLKFNWGATYHVAGVLDWRHILTKAMKNLEAFPEGPDLPSLSSAAAKEGLEEKLQFLGTREDVYALLGQSSIFLYFLTMRDHPCNLLDLHQIF